MPLYYITGIAGSGKSTVLAELKHRGYEAYDVDEAGPATAKWHNDTTGFVHPKSSVKAADRTPEFLAQHSWKVPRAEVVALAEQAGSNTVFLGGSIANETELQDLFSIVFALVIDDAVLQHRLATRTNNDWGKHPHELAYTLDTNHKLDHHYKQMGYVALDGSLPTGEVITELLSHIHDNR